jgi:diphthamide synthase (EF-2-diphthine--ammonia ligase)
VFGDLFLEDIRTYRERMLTGTGLEPLFPVWQISTAQLAREMHARGLRARVACIDRRVLDRSFAGREYDASFLADLPAAVDPCGENGEFHTFVYDAPMFRCPIAVEPGELHEDGYFTFADLLCPVSSH